MRSRSDPATLTGQAFRTAMSAVATSVAVVTTRDGERRPHGVTVGTLTSLSLDPPLVLFCVARSGSAHDPLTTADRFLISVLTDSQHDVARRFAAHADERFARATEDWHGLPTVPGALVRLLCRGYDQVAGGDHTIVIGEVQAAQWGAGRPLLHYQRAFHALT
jgi:flavin reductase ActVB